MMKMGSALGPSLNNTFLGHYKQIWCNDYPDEFKPVYYKRYVNDIFAGFFSYFLTTLKKLMNV